MKSEGEQINKLRKLNKDVIKEYVQEIARNCEDCESNLTMSFIISIQRSAVQIAEICEQEKDLIRREEKPNGSA